MFFPDTQSLQAAACRKKQEAFSRTRKVWSDHRANGGQVKGGGEGQIKQKEGEKKSGRICKTCKYFVTLKRRGQERRRRKATAR